MYACCTTGSFVFSVIIPIVVLTKVVTSGVVGRMVERQPESSGGPGTAHPTREPTEPEFSGGRTRNGAPHEGYQRPVVTPDAYTGDSSWTDWADHFEAVAKVNGWDDSIGCR